MKWKWNHVVWVVVWEKIIKQDQKHWTNARWRRGWRWSCVFRRNRADLIESATPCHDAQKEGSYRVSNPLRLTVLAAKSEDYITAPQQKETWHKSRVTQRWKGYSQKAFSAHSVAALHTKFDLWVTAHVPLSQQKPFDGLKLNNDKHNYLYSGTDKPLSNSIWPW